MEILLRQLRPFIYNEEAYGRIHADLEDLMEIFQWFNDKLQSAERKILSTDELENLLIEIDVRFIDHANFHMRSLKKEIRKMLKKFPNEDE